MDGLELTTATEEVVITSKHKRKRSNPRFYRYLLACLAERKFEHMLSYVPGSDKKEFQITYIDRKKRKDEVDIALFKYMDEHLGRLFNRKRPQEKYAEECKNRFRSNINKCLKSKYIELLSEDKSEKCKIVKKFKILQRLLPPVGETNSYGGQATGSSGNTKGKSAGKWNKMGKNYKGISLQENSRNKNRFLRIAALLSFLKHPSTIPQMEMDKNEFVDYLENSKTPYPLKDFDTGNFVMESPNLNIAIDTSRGNLPDVTDFVMESPNLNIAIDTSHGNLPDMTDYEQSDKYEGLFTEDVQYPKEMPDSPMNEYNLERNFKDWRIDIPSEDSEDWSSIYQDLGM